MVAVSRCILQCMRCTMLWFIIMSIRLFPVYSVTHGNENICKSIYVELKDFGEATIDINNWNGVYSLDTSATSFNASIWKVNDHKWLKYIETQWVLSGKNDELLIYHSSNLFPPTNTTSIWIHEFYPDLAQLQLICSLSFSPTRSPTLSPSPSPTFSPTLSSCGVLQVSDSSNTNNNDDIYFNHWLYQRLPRNDYNGRPIWQYQHGIIESFIQFLPMDGWTVFLNDGFDITIYSNRLFGYFPPLKTPQLFNITSNGALPRNFTFICLETVYPTKTPTLSPTVYPTQSPIHTVTSTQTESSTISSTDLQTIGPTLNPSISPSVTCDVLQILIPNNVHDDAKQCNISFHKVFNDIFWLKQISRSNRPSWTLDCDDNNEEYMKACNDGYSGSIFYISNQWEIQIYSRNDNCFERFIVENTVSYFVPTESIWIRQSTMNPYTLIIHCVNKIIITTPSLTEEHLMNKNEVYIYNEIWFWISLLFIVLICGLLCFGVNYHWSKKRRKPIVVHRPNPMVSISNVSRQYVELQRTPKAAYVHYQVAPTHDDDDDDDDEGESNSDVVLLYETNNDSCGFIGSTSNDVIVNPNLKRNTVGTFAGYDNTGERMIIDNNDSNDKESKDKALDIIAGNKKVTGGYIQHNNDICYT